MLNNYNLIFIGPFGINGYADGGSSMKNQLLSTSLKNFFKVKIINTSYKFSSVVNIFFLLFRLYFDKSSKIIISTSFRSAYYSIKIFDFFKFSNRVIYWVVGGQLAQKIEENNLKTKYYKKLRSILVQGVKMKKDLEDIGIYNVFVVPNLKPINYLPPLKENITYPIKFVFLSRITPTKGCEEIFQACKILNNKGFKDKFNFTFYGPLFDDYEKFFHNHLKEFSNVFYSGFLDFKNELGYNELAQYDCMIFPTFWPTEGFPGVILDAFIAGLPVIASDWNLNGELIKDGINGFLIPAKDSKTLANIMETIILDPEILIPIKKNNQRRGKDYNIDTFINTPFLKSVGLI